MKRVLSTLIAGLLATALLTSTAWSQEGTMPDWADKSGGFGVGAETTLGGVNGLNLRYYINNAFGLQLVFGMFMHNETVDVDGGDDTTSKQTGLGFGFYGMYKLAYWQRGHLSGILGLDIATYSQTTSVGDNDDESSGTDILLGLGLMGEVFLSQYFSVFGQVGLRLDFIGEDEVECSSTYGCSYMENKDTSGIDIRLSGDLLGHFGFTVWFK